MKQWNIVRPVVLISLWCMLLFPDRLFAAVEIDLGGISDNAQRAIKSMSEDRQRLKSELEQPLTQLKTLHETYVNTCGKTNPQADSGCTEQYNQIIGAYQEVLTKVGTFLKSYNQKMEVVIQELEPQLQQIANNHSPSDINEDLISKYEEGDYIDDPFITGIEQAFGLDKGLSALEVVSDTYMQYSQEIAAYKTLQRKLERKILQATRMKDLSPILNDETRKELANLTSWIYGAKMGKAVVEKQPKKRIIAR